MRATHTPHLSRLLLCALLSSTALLGAALGSGQALAQDGATANGSIGNGTPTLEEFQRRIDVCGQAEEWLRATCLESLYQGMAQQTGQGIGAVAPHMADTESAGAGAAGAASPITESVASQAFEWPGVASMGEAGSASMDSTVGQPNSTAEALVVPPITSAPVPPPPMPQAAPTPFDELHMIGVYEPQTVQQPDGSIVQSPIPVRIDRPGQALALALSAYEPVIWNIATTEGTSITRIALGGMGAARSAVFVNGQPMAAEAFEGLIVYQQEQYEFHPHYDAVRSLLGADKAGSFHGAYTAPANGFTIADAPGVPTKEEESTALAGMAVQRGTLPGTFQQALTGQQQNSTLSFDQNGFSGILADGTFVSAPFPLDLPAVHSPGPWAADVAGKRLWALNTGGGAFLYGYDIPTQTWKAYKIQGYLDAGSLYHDASTDTLLAAPAMMGRTITRLATNGKVLQQHAFDPATLPGLNRMYNRGNGPEPAFTILAAEGALVLLKAESMDNVQGAPSKAYYLFNLANGEATPVL